MSIEHFINQNREGFDSEAPSAAVWEAIERELPKPKADEPSGWSLLRGGKFAKMAAAVALLLMGVGLGYGIGQRGAESTEMQIASINPELGEAASYYQRDISAKKQKLAQFTSETASVESDLVHLERVMEELKSELESVPPAQRQSVVTAMLENYKTRASILEKVLMHLEQQNSKSQKNEPTNI
jgi:predicted RNase H-like nuclease (RuvC/YqgF family)